MTDLNKKQAFWAEQLPLFKEKYWLPEHLDVLEFNMDGGCFEIPVDVKTDFSEDDLLDIYHRVNSGWAMWKKAVTFMQEKAKAQAVPEKVAVIKKLSDQLYAQEMITSAARVLCETACELLDDYAHQDAMVILNDLEQAMLEAQEPTND